jgi:hypothetical protein
MRALIASMLSSDPERSWFRIEKASLGTFAAARVIDARVILKPAAT